MWDKHPSLSAPTAANPGTYNYYSITLRLLQDGHVLLVTSKKDFKVLEDIIHFQYVCVYIYI